MKSHKKGETLNIHTNKEKKIFSDVCIQSWFMFNKMNETAKNHKIGKHILFLHEYIHQLDNNK